MKEKPRLISAAIDPKVFPDSDDDDDDDPITVPVSAQTSGEEDLPLESSCSTLDSPLVAFSAPPSPSPPNTPSAFEASIGPDWRAGLASAENDDDDDDFKEAVEKVEPAVKDKVDDQCVGYVVAVNNAAEGETEVEEEDEDATQCAADIECSPKQARFNATATTNANSSDSSSSSSSISGVAGIEVKCSAMTIQEKLKNIDAAARTSHGTSVSEPLTSSSATASRELWMGKGTISPIMSPASSRLSSPVPASPSSSASAVKSVGGGFILKALGQGQGADRDGDDSGDGGEDLGEIVNKATPEKPCKEDYSSGSQNSEKQRLNRSYSRNGSQNNTTHSSSSSSNSSSSNARYQHHTGKYSLNNINAIDANKANRQSQGPHKNRNLSDALSGKKTSISKPTQETFYSKKS